MEATDLSQIVWRAPEWINALGGLRTDNILEYFSQSPFFDRSSNNAVLKQQSQFQNFGDIPQALQKMRGVEFAIYDARPPDLWTIAKQVRESVEEVQVVNMYFIANGNIYQAPDVDAIMQSRLLNISSSIAEALDALKAQVSFTPAGGYQYGPKPGPATEPDASRASTAREEADTKAMHKALFSAMQAQ
ncbi:MED6 mediator sub complex component-domain-containing protein [Protomyces lactucae-debilis]|uniref:Mediator of RNA polymerase II transcription subunit 6 n=1 Tax=Protomyces lactucae-debilis TaxID=2754530 RepID=A0A1Y2FPG0_PROLT|nr:MED6 mediator sub complex component-domain-containing protein [Protomyces lactucae-debilis]ORY85487.1 MED6 mediator sub complex component-domain-containing protein [Protomyces lactucae-debilis]